MPGHMDALGLGLGAPVGEGLPGELVVDLRHLGSKRVPDVPRDARVCGKLGAQLLHRRLHLGRALPLAGRFHGPVHLLEESLLILEDRGGAERAVARTHRLRPQLARAVQGVDPVADLPIPNVVVGTVHAGVSREQDLLLRQPGEAVAVGVGGAEVAQLHPVDSVVEDQSVREEHARGLELRGPHVLALLRGVFPPAGLAAEQSRLVLLHLLDHARVRHRRGALLDPHLVAVGVVPVVMGVEGETDRLVGDRADLGDDLPGPRGEVRVDDEDVVLEDDPAVVAVALALDVALVEVHVGSELPDLCKRLMELPSCSARPPMIVALDSAARLFHDARPVMRVAAVCLPALLVSPVHAQLPDAGTLTVEVRSEGRPLAGATVSAGALQGTTDVAGHATLFLAPGPYEIRVEAAGHLPASVRVSVAAGPTPPVSVELRPLAEEVTVTTTRSTTRLQDQPLRVEVIDRDDIEEKALMTPGNVAMLLGETTGLRVQTTAPSLGAANVRIQGLRGHYSQLLADGLPLYGAQGDSFSLMQVPPLDLRQVEVIKGVASALYGASALGGVVNLVSRRPRGHEEELLLNATTLGGVDATGWLARAGEWSWSAIGGYHSQARRDVDGDGWTDVAGYDRGLLRPRLSFDDGRGTTVLATTGVIAENREGGSIDGGRAPDGQPFVESLRSRHIDAGFVGKWLMSGRLVSFRGSFVRTAQDRRFGLDRERGAHLTWFGEASITGTS